MSYAISVGLVSAKNRTMSGVYSISELRSALLRGGTFLEHASGSLRITGYGIENFRIRYQFLTVLILDYHYNSTVKF